MGKILKWIAQKVGWEWHVTCDLCGSRNIASTDDWWCRLCHKVVDTGHRHKYITPIRKCNDCKNTQHA